MSCYICNTIFQMDYIIAPALFQHKICRLPGIGTLCVESGSTAVDFVNARLLPPAQRIVFTPENAATAGFNEFAPMGMIIRKELEDRKQLQLSGIGTFDLMENGTIQFSPVEIPGSFLPNVTAERVIRQDATHHILVGDRETDSVVMTEYFADKPIQKDYWWIWAIALLAIGLVIVGYYLSQFGWNNLSSKATFL